MKEKIDLDLICENAKKKLYFPKQDSILTELLSISYTSFIIPTSISPSINACTLLAFFVIFFTA
mgnify:CR=1 FL=1